MTFHPVTLRHALAEAHAALREAGVAADESALDAELLAREVLGWDRARFFAHDTDPATPGFLQSYRALVARRAAREPVSQILGRREFWGLDFEITPDVLTPRPETELIIEEAIARLADRRHEALAMADVGTGTGCLAICLAREFPLATVLGVDVSASALAVAARNASRHGVAGRVRFQRSSLLDAVTGPLALVVSNPPYVPAPDIPGLPEEVRDHEPREALDGGPDGLVLVRQLFADAPRVLAPGGWLVCEFGFGQAEGIRQAAAQSRLDLVGIRDDLQGIPRTAVLKYGAHGLDTRL